MDDNATGIYTFFFIFWMIIISDSEFQLIVELFIEFAGMKVIYTINYYLINFLVKFMSYVNIIRSQFILLKFFMATIKYNEVIILPK